MKSKIPEYLLQKESRSKSLPDLRNSKQSFAERTLRSATGAFLKIYKQAEFSSKIGFIQKIQPSVKVFSLLFLAVVVSFVPSIRGQLPCTAFVLTGFILTRINLKHVYDKIIFLALFFGVFVMAPAALNMISPGEIIFPLISFNHSHQFLIYNIPEKIGFTFEGCRIVLLMFLRILNTVSLAFLIVYTTPFSSFVKGFRIVGMPTLFMMVIILTHKFIFILSRSVEEIFWAMKSRLISGIKNQSIRKILSGRIFFVFKKARNSYEYTYMAMVSRGYTGKIQIHHNQKFKKSDGLILILVITLGAGMLWIGY